jgi:mono/diheme cytochrome c family protein
MAFRHRLNGTVLALGALLAVGCDWPGKPDPAARERAAEELTSFAPLYRQNCVGCHGADGQLGPAPPLNDALFLAIVPEAELEGVIRNGRRGTPMPAFGIAAGGELSDMQLTALVQGLKSHWKSDEKFDEPLPPYLSSDGNDSTHEPGDRERGATLFAAACAGCHGENGRGEEGSDVANAIHEPAFLALISNQALRRIIITGRSDLGMPNFAGKDGRPDDFSTLTSPQIDDLVALLAQWRDERGQLPNPHLSNAP